MGGRIRVLVVDDHPVVREGLKAVLGLSAEFEVVGEGTDGTEAVARYRELRPDVAIIDLRLPRLGGVEAIAEIRKLDPEASILALTSFGGDVEIRLALDAGARGFLMKGSSSQQLLEALQRVSAGVQAVCQEAEAELSHYPFAPGLSPREIDVLALVAEGLHNHEIAERLRISLSTVKAHLNRILEKLDAEDRTEAVTTAVKRGLIRLS